MLPPHRVVQDEQAIARRVAELARRIAAEAPAGPLLVVGALTGSFVFVADLVRALSREGRDVRVELIPVSLYVADGRPAGTVRLGTGPAKEDPAGRCVLLVDDILDSGRTLAALRDLVSASGPAWLRTCVLLDKPAGAPRPVEADHAGFEAPDEWVFGYGLDTEGFGRGLPYLAVAVAP